MHILFYGTPIFMAMQWEKSWETEAICGKIHNAMRILNGQEIAEFIKERQAAQVRALRQAHKIFPKLAIIRTNPAPVVDSYMRLKRSYGEDVLIDVDVHTVKQEEALALIKTLNADDTVHGIIVQLPIPDPTQTTEILDAVDPVKDVDGLHSNPVLDAATPTAILWLLAGYNVELRAKNILIVGQGRLVGQPLARMMVASGLEVTTADRHTNDLPTLVRQADVIISATGVPGLLKSDMLKPGAVVVDAGVATDKNGLVGDVAEDARERNDLTITPVKGGVGPLTVCALFDNVIRVAQKVAASNKD
jgi:methylenetetrahydrofolate dehydrogenase (NADP+) / methenyltetrahydrofolate cyclohydrolase